MINIAANAADQCGPEPECSAWLKSFLMRMQTDALDLDAMMAEVESLKGRLTMRLANLIQEQNPGRQRGRGICKDDGPPSSPQPASSMARWIRPVASSINSPRAALAVGALRPLPVRPQGADRARAAHHPVRVGCPRIAQEITHAFGIDINKDIVRRVLAKNYRPEAGTDGPSWLTFIGHVKDSLWSVDLFRCESILLRSHWVMVVMDVFTRRIIGFGVERADPCGMPVCRMFNQIIAGKSLPRHLSSRPRPTISLPSLARQLAHTRGRRDQVDPIRTHVPSVRGTAGRNDPTRVS